MHRSLFALVSIAAMLTQSPGAPTRAAPRVLLRSVTAPTLTPVGPAKYAKSVPGAPLGPAALRFGRSIGSPTEGRLVGGAHLEEAPYLRIVPFYAAGDVRWGLEPLVSLLDRAARAVRRQFPDAVASVGHLSRAGGGDIERHRSHESGRDADVSFFVRTAAGRPLLPTHFVPFRADGSALGWPGAYFDDAKNWALVAALVSDVEAHVTHLFVASPLRARLLAYAERTGASSATRLRAAEAMQQPRGALPHDDHFHVRIGCPAHMSGCVENPPPRVVSHASPSFAARGRRGALDSPATLLPLPTPPPKRVSPPSPPVSRPGEPVDIVVPPVPIDDVDG